MVYVNVRVNTQFLDGSACKVRLTVEEGYYKDAMQQLVEIGGALLWVKRDDIARMLWPE